VRRVEFFERQQRDSQAMDADSSTQARRASTSSASASEQRYLRHRLNNFFELYAPAKAVIEVPRLLALWADRPSNKLFEELEKQYGPEPPIPPPMSADRTHGTSSASSASSPSYFQADLDVAAATDSSNALKERAPVKAADATTGELSSPDGARRASHSGFMSYVTKKASKAKLFGAGGTAHPSSSSDKGPQTSFAVATEVHQMSGFSIRPGNVYGWLMKNWETLNTWKQLFYVFDFEAHVMYECDSDDGKTPPRKVVSILTSRVADNMDASSPTLHCFNLFVRGGRRGNGGPDSDSADSSLKIYKLGVQSTVLYERWVSSLRRGLSSRSSINMQRQLDAETPAVPAKEAETQGHSGVTIIHPPEQEDHDSGSRKRRGSASADSRQMQAATDGTGAAGDDSGNSKQSLNALVVIGGRRYNLRCEPRSTNAWLLSEAIRVYMRENNNDDPGITGLFNTTQNSVMDLSEDVQDSYNSGDIVEAVVEDGQALGHGSEAGRSNDAGHKQPNTVSFSGGDGSAGMAAGKARQLLGRGGGESASGQSADDQLRDKQGGVSSSSGGAAKEGLAAVASVHGADAGGMAGKVSPALQRAWYRKERGESLGTYEANWEQQAEEEEAEEGRREELKQNSKLLRTGSTGSNTAGGMVSAPWDTRGAEAVADGWRTQVHQGELIGRPTGVSSRGGVTTSSLLGSPWQSSRDRHQLLKYLRSHPGVSPNTHAAAQLVLEAMDPVMPFWLGYDWHETKVRSDMLC
jgi:hypothetical protein